MNPRRRARELQGTEWVMNEEGTHITVNDTTKFVLPKLYPFVCPQLIISQHTHVEFLRHYLLRYADFCQAYHITLPCVCCRSIVTRWSPYYTCKDIYKEFLFFKNMGYYLHVLQKLCDKNIPDIIIKEISSYLL